MSDNAVLVTRPKGDEKTLTDALHARGHRVIHEPLTEILLYHTERQALQQALLAEPDAVIVTSRHGVQALALLTDLRDAFLICVGEETAKAAHSQGFMRVSAAGGNARSLIEYIISGYDPGSRFLYASGLHVRAEIDAVLTERGMPTQRIGLYEAVAAQQFSDTLLEQMKRGQVHAATFLSQRTAQIFTSLLAKAGAERAAGHMHAVALSATVAEPLVGAPWKSIRIASEATLASLVASIDNVFEAKE